jgi:CubicO group peptidase (beta-lactamase class C family)
MSDDNQLPRTRAVIEQGIADGLHLGAQLYTSIRNVGSGELAVGESRSGVRMSRDTIVLWMSAGKPVAAVAILQLRERGLCELDDSVATHIPEFAANGKDAITIRHLLTHTGGFRWVDVGPPGTPWDEIIAKTCAARLERNWIPGEKAGYHPYSSWYILGELVRRLDGRPYSQYVRDEIFEPLEMYDCWVGMPEEQRRAYGTRIGQTIVNETATKHVHPWSTERGLVHCAPGGNSHGPMHELARLYEMLLGGGQRDGVRVLSAESVQLMTSRQRVGMFDATFQKVIDWGLGVIVNSRKYGDDIPYGYGPYASSETFGHSGNQSSVAFGDPEFGLAVALAFNGMPGEARHQERVVTALAAIYEDLGLSAVRGP